MVEYIEAGSEVYYQPLAGPEEIFFCQGLIFYLKFSLPLSGIFAPRPFFLGSHPCVYSMEDNRIGHSGISTLFNHRVDLFNYLAYKENEGLLH